MNGLARSIFTVGPEARYVATCLRGELELNQRDGLTNLSGSESDKYEKLLEP